MLLNIQLPTEFNLHSGKKNLQNTINANNDSDSDYGDDVIALVSLVASPSTCAVALTLHANK